MNWRCRWFGHKKRSLDGDANGVSIRNIDACDHCGQVFVAKHARAAHYAYTKPLSAEPNRVYWSKVDLLDGGED